MVQADDTVQTKTNENITQTLSLLKEMNTNAQHVTQLVDNMILKVRKGELSTKQGLSFLEMKYHMLLSYLINVTYVILRKCSGESIEGDPSIDRLVEIRTILEKIRPIDHKLKYQIDKLVKAAVVGTIEHNDHSMFRANPDMLNNEQNASSDEEQSDIEDKTALKRNKDKPQIYVPPKLAAVHYEFDEERSKHKKKHSLHSSVLDDLREEYLDVPIEISSSNMTRAQKALSHYEREKQEFEENYLTRLPETKEERIRRRKLNTVGNIADEIIFGSNSSTTKRKRKSGKIKGKGSKKKRYN